MIPKSRVSSKLFGEADICSLEARVQIKWLKHPFYSVFTKLIAVMLISGSFLVIGIAGISWHGFRENRKIFFRNNLAQYGAYLVGDLQENLNLEHARELSRRLFLIIRYEGKNDSWQTSSGIPPLQKIHFRKWSGKSGASGFQLIAKSHRPFVTTVRYGRYHRQGVVIVETQNGRFIFAEVENDWQGIRFASPWIFAVLGLVGLVLTGTWLVLRRILKPINWLSEGVSALGAGNLEHRLPEKRGDELGNLARAFNRMSERLHKMLTAREQLLLDVSHELRSPLTRIKVALEFLPKGKNREGLRDDVREMDQMIAEILETARLKSEYGKLNLQEIDLVCLIQELCLGFEEKLQEQSPGISFEKHPKICQTYVDVEQIRTVLKNLLANALKYSPPENAPVEIRLNENTSGIQIEIQDYGPGIPEDERDLIFEPFYRIDKSRNKKTGGYGLGLSLCKTIIEAHGGTISVQSDSEPDIAKSKPHGSTFCLKLPH